MEAHRVRKRLHEYYEDEGAGHRVRIELPAGQYAPRFIVSEISAGAVPQAPAGASELQHLPAPVVAHHQARAWTLAVVLAIAIVIGLPWMLLSRQKTAPPSHTVPAATKLSVMPEGDTVRILAGRPSGDYVDRNGTRWSADEYFNGGTAAPVRYHSLALVDDPEIYQQSRSGEDFSYDIPLRPGVYEMRLMFAESGEAAIVGSVGDGTRSFHVTANGIQVVPPLDQHHMRELDIFADAGGVNIGDVKVVKGLTPAPDGKLHLRFIGRNQRALVNAIEIVPGLNGRMRPLRWRANDTPYTDHAGNLWLPDRYFRGGRLSRFHAVVSRTPDPDLYRTERFGSFTYYVPVPAGSTYTVRLHFAENYFGAWVPQVTPPRIFSVYANHALLLHDFDIARESGGTTTALTKVFRGLRPNVFDKIVLSFEPSTEFAVVNGIEVEDEAK